MQSVVSRFGINQAISAYPAIKIGTVILTIPIGGPGAGSAGGKACVLL